MTKIKKYFPRLIFVLFVLLLLIPSTREVGFFISQLIFGLDIKNSGFGFAVSLLMFGFVAWTGYELVAQVASSLGYRDSKDNGFIVTGNGNIIHLPESANNSTVAPGKSNILELQNYESGSPLIALQQSKIRINEHISGLRARPIRVG